MVQCRGSPGFEQEAIQCGLFARHLGRQEFERDLATQGKVLRFVYDAHAAAAQPGSNAVMRDDLIDHA